MKKKNDDKQISYADIPLGLSSALSRNIGAMRAFAEMTREGQESFIQGAHGIKSKAEMREYVSSIEAK